MKSRQQIIDFGISIGLHPVAAAIEAERIIAARSAPQSAPTPTQAPKATATPKPAPVSGKRTYTASIPMQYIPAEFILPPKTKARR